MRCITIKVKIKDKKQLIEWESRLSKGCVIYSITDYYKEDSMFYVWYSIMLGDPIDSTTAQNIEKILADSRDILPILVPRKEYTL